MNKDYLKKIIENVNLLLKSENIPLVSENEVKFVFDKDLDLTVPLTVNEPKMFSSEKLNDEISSIILKGPSWIHANLIFLKDGTKIIALSYGSLVGNSNPSVNVSLEKIKIA